jgi:uncharacterized membrane protein YcjF (UPF0283 family)
MSDEFREQMYNELNLRETEDLLEIWQTNDHEEWSDMAFEIIKEILIQRLGEIPSQEEPIPEQNESVDEVEEATTKEETPEDNRLEEWEAKLLDDEDQPEFYDTLEVIMLKNSINKVAKGVIIVYALQSIATFGWFSQIVGSYFQDRQAFVPLIYLISFVLVVLGAVISIAIIYFPLKALAHILRILMEMEFRSRQGNVARSAG